MRMKKTSPGDRKFNATKRICLQELLAHSHIQNSPKNSQLLMNGGRFEYSHLSEAERGLDLHRFSMTITNVKFNIVRHASRFCTVFVNVCSQLFPSFGMKPCFATKNWDQPRQSDKSNLPDVLEVPLRDARLHRSVA